MAVIIVLSDALFVLIAAIAVRQWLQHRDQSRFWFMVTFLVVITVLVLALITKADKTAGWESWLTKIEIIILILFPYALYRFSTTFERGRHWVERLIACSATILAIVVVILANENFRIATRAHSIPHDTLYNLWVIGFLLHWTIVSGIVAWRLWRGGRHEPPIPQRLMRLLASGVILIALALITAPLTGVGSAQILTQALILIAALALFIGFSPPEVLLRNWRFPEEQRIRTILSHILTVPSVEEAVNLILPRIAGLFSGDGVLLMVNGKEFSYGNAPATFPGVAGQTEEIFHRDLGEKGYVMVPMEEGKMVIATSPYAPFFSSSAIDLARSMGTILNLLFERELRVEEAAQRAQAEAGVQLLQQAFLPEVLPEIPGLDLFAAYLPARLKEQVGGDWFDAFLIGPSHIGVVIGDVAGKGLPAAALMGRLRNALWAYFSELSTPIAALSALERLVAQLDAHTLTTTACAVLDLGSRKLQYTSSGHLPMLLIREGQARLLEVGDPPLGAGVLPGAEYTEQMQPGDQLVFYTDGLVERRNESITDSLAKLTALAASAPAGAEALVNYLREHMLPDGAGDDDTAILVVEISATENFVARMPARPQSLPRIRHLLSVWLDEKGVTAEERADILLATGEAVANAIEHAYSVTESDLTISARREGDRIEAIIADNGHWRPARGDDRRGRGLPLMQGLMDEVKIQPNGHGTSIVLRKELDDES
jgi:serine phosphatase RsbU (regulator of sigma subunit)/anti-sigma regulatory factor (Ser/Thr protein kinase)